MVLNLILTGTDTKGLFVDRLSEEVKRFNNLVPPEEQLTIKENVEPLDCSWNIPQEYKDLDLVDYLINKLYELEIGRYSTDFDVRAKRVATELALYNKLNIENVLRTIIYIINTLDSKNVVWGVGRGSSVSSYVLYLIGVHDVDSVLYDLDINDFLRI
jgi:DNA polymerase III alpha subunit